MSQHAKIISNLQHAIALMELVPQENVDLGVFLQHTSRGSIRDTAGWLTASAFFTLQGMELREYGAAYALFDKMNPDSQAADMDWLDRIFGDQAFDTLFALYGQGRFDRFAFTDGEPAPSDKALAIYRLRRQLALYERVAQHEEFLTPARQEQPNG